MTIPPPPSELAWQIRALVRIHALWLAERGDHAMPSDAVPERTLTEVLLAYAETKYAGSDLDHREHRLDAADFEHIPWPFVPPSSLWSLTATMTEALKIEYRMRRLRADFAWDWPDGPGSTPPAMPLHALRHLHREHLRRQRREAWPAADAAWFQAVEAGDADRIAAAVTLRRRLRDLPADPRIEAAETIEALRALTYDRLMEDA